jgi:hypothetical protein
MRQVGARALAGLFALSWLIFPGFGLIDLSVTWSSEWPQVLEAGWGLFFTVLVGAAFVLAVLQPADSRAGIVQLGTAALCLVVAAAATAEWRLLALAGAVAVEAALVGLLLRPAAWHATRRGRSVPLFLLAAAGTVPWAAYAVQMWRLNGGDRPDGDQTLGIDHFSVQGALGLALALLPLAAALSRELVPFVPVCAGVSAAYLGLVSLGWPHAAGAHGTVWSALATAWGLALVGVALAALRRARASG